LIPNDDLFSISGSYGDHRLSYYNDEQIRLVMDDVAQHLGCHVEKIDLLFNPWEGEGALPEWE
jgi:hypothetical protein